MASDLVTAEWLLEHIGDPGIRIVDCRWVLGQAPDAPALGR